jgi:hypothetical protein
MTRWCNRSPKSFRLKIDDLPAPRRSALPDHGPPEIDFFGGYFANDNNTHPMAHPRLRCSRMELASWDVADKIATLRCRTRSLATSVPGFTERQPAALAAVRAEAAILTSWPAGAAPAGAGGEGGSGPHRRLK